MPLVAPNGHRIGVLCVIDSSPKKLNEKQKQLLSTLSNQVINYLELRKKSKDIININNDLKRILEILNETNSIAKVGGWDLDVETGDLNWTDETFKILEVDKTEGSKPHLDEGLQLFTDEHKPIIDKAVNDAIEFGKPYSLELKALTAKGNELWVYTNGRAHYEDGKVKTLSGTIQNIDNRKKAEIQLEKERQVHIQQSKLLAIRELAAGVGHEINNALAISEGSLEQLKNEVYKSPKIEKIIENIHNANYRIKRISEGLRKFSRHDDNQVDFDIVEAIEESLSFVQNIYKNSGIDIKFINNNGREAFIHGNRGEIQQVLLNLLSNAKDAVDKKDKKEISISLENLESKAIIKVKDNGCGINESDKDQIFNAFYTSKEYGKGTGIGLSLSKKIVIDNQGKIYFNSTENVGSEFLIEFNLVESTKFKVTEARDKQVN